MKFRPPDGAHPVDCAPMRIDDANSEAKISRYMSSSSLKNGDSEQFTKNCSLSPFFSRQGATVPLLLRVLPGSGARPSPDSTRSRVKDTNPVRKTSGVRQQTAAASREVPHQADRTGDAAL